MATESLKMKKYLVNDIFEDFILYDWNTGFEVVSDIPVSQTWLYHHLPSPAYNHEQKGKRVHFETIKEATFKVKFLENISFEQTYILK